MGNPSSKTKKEFWRSVFRKIMAYYDEVKTTNGTRSCQGFYKALSQEGSGGGKYNPKVVRPSLSDFVCDVEITARKSLTPQEFRFFKLVYLDKDPEICGLLDTKSPDNKFNKLKHSVQEKVGFGFISAKIHPLVKYNRAKDLR